MPPNQTPVEIKYQELRPDRKPWPKGIQYDDVTHDYFIEDETTNTYIYFQSGDRVRVE